RRHGGGSGGRVPAQPSDRAGRRRPGRMEARRTASMRVVVVAAEGEATRRAALSLSTHPDVEVALLGPTTSSQFPVVHSAIGYYAVVGSERAAIEAGIPAVVPGALERHFGVEHCSIAGLALALAADVEGVGTVAVAVPGAGGGDQEVTFPSPIDSRRARVIGRAHV